MATYPLNYLTSGSTTVTVATVSNSYQFPVSATDCTHFGIENAGSDQLTVTNTENGKPVIYTIPVGGETIIPNTGASVSFISTSKGNAVITYLTQVKSSVGSADYPQQLMDSMATNCFIRTQTLHEADNAPLNPHGGQSVILANYAGSGAIDHIWVTCNNTNFCEYRLQVYVDGEASPAIDAEIGTLFGVINVNTAAPYDVGTNNIGYKLTSSNGKFPGTIWFKYPIPFSSKVRVVIYNPTTDATQNSIWTRVSINPGVVSNLRLRSTGSYNWNNGGTTVTNTDLILANIDSGSGYLAHVGYGGWDLVAVNTGKWQERDFVWYEQNSASTGVILGTGTEDFFDGAFYQYLNRNPYTYGSSNFDNATNSAGLPAGNVRNCKSMVKDLIALRGGIRYTDGFKLVAPYESNVTTSAATYVWSILYYEDVTSVAAYAKEATPFDFTQLPSGLEAAYDFTSDRWTSMYEWGSLPLYAISRNNRPVGYVVDKSGNGHNLLNTNATDYTRLGTAMVQTLVNGNPALTSKNGVSSGNITSATNATPIVITTSANHGLSTNDTVYIQNVGGNTNANGRWRVTVLTSTTFSLKDMSTGADRAGNAAYTSGGTWSSGAQWLRTSAAKQFSLNDYDILVFGSITWGKDSRGVFANDNLQGTTGQHTIRIGGSGELHAYPNAGSDMISRTLDGSGSNVPYTSVGIAQGAACAFEWAREGSTYSFFANGSQLGVDQTGSNAAMVVDTIDSWSQIPQPAFVRNMMLVFNRKLTTAERAYTVTLVRTYLQSLGITI